MLFAIFLLIADINCVDNGDGTWTCSGNTQTYPNVTTNGEGQAVCTNCVNMTPARCRQLKQDLIDAGTDAFEYAGQASSRASEILLMLDRDISKYYSFTDCPYPFDYAGGTPNTASTLLRMILNDASASSNSSNYNAAAITLGNQFNTCPQVINYQVITSVSIPTFGGVSLTVTQQFASFCWNVASMWHASYLIAQDAYASLSQIRGSVAQLNTDILNIAHQLTIIGDRALAITCDPCEMASGDGSSSGGSGVDQGCRECYLAFLRRFQQQLDQIIDLLDSIDKTTSRIYTTVVSGFSTLHSDIAGLGYYAERIDDYLQGEQKEYIIQIQAGVDAISNQVYTLQKHFYHTFSNASDIANGVYNDPADGSSENFQQVLNTVFNSPDNQNSFDVSKYHRFDWFRRIELLLGDIAGLSSVSNPTSVSDSAIDIVNSAVENLENLSDLPGEGSTYLMTNGEALKGLSQSIAGIFPSSPQSITLLEARYWIGDTDLTLNIDSTVVQFARTITGLIWTIFAAVALWLLLVHSWIFLVDLVKFFVNWISSIFGN